MSKGGICMKIYAIILLIFCGISIISTPFKIERGADSSFKYGLMGQVIREIVFAIFITLTLIK
jgi:hypothetical protein